MAQQARHDAHYAQLRENEVQASVAKADYKREMDDRPRHSKSGRSASSVRLEPPPPGDTVEHGVPGREGSQFTRGGAVVSGQESAILTRTIRSD